MKQVLTLLLALGSIALYGCQGPIGPTGPAGPTGSQGPTGPQGPSGNSNISTNIIKIAASDFSTVNSWKTEADYNETAITSGIVDSGLVYAYLSQDQGQTWTALPISYEGTTSTGASLTVTLNFGFAQGLFALVIVSTEANNNASHAAIFDGDWVKFVVLPKAASSVIIGIDPTNYALLMNAIGK